VRGDPVTGASRHPASRDAASASSHEAKHLGPAPPLPHASLVTVKVIRQVKPGKVDYRQDGSAKGPRPATEPRSQGRGSQSRQMSFPLLQTVSIPFTSGKGFARIKSEQATSPAWSLNPLQVGEGFCTVDFAMVDIMKVIVESQSPSSRGRVLHAGSAPITKVPYRLNPLQVGEGFCTFRMSGSRATRT